MARFGHLYLRAGRWADRQVVPADWVLRSTTPYTTGLARAEMPFQGYGFLWWTTDWGYTALGRGGHVIAVHPAKRRVSSTLRHLAWEFTDFLPLYFGRLEPGC